MHRWSRARSAAAAVVVLAGCGLAAGAAGALPVAGMATTAEPGGAIVQRAAHSPKEWHWHGEWGRQGPWADHVIEGVVVTRPRPSAVFVPWGNQRQLHCATKYRGYDPVTGTYLTRRGKRRMCR